jgi:cyclophilin family peptidyl-prolyl cis-trans isomerase
MRKILIILLASAMSLSACKKKNTRVVIETSMGAIKVELFDSEAPETVKNFLKYADSGFYQGTIFHRVIRNFMIQTGGFTDGMVPKEAGPAIKNEAKNGIRNTRGTLAMARTADINSATSQFFINTVDNSFLDHGVRDYGYCVFGRVIEGMDIVDAIQSMPVQNAGFHQDVPVESIIIRAVNRLKDSPGK